MRVSAQHSASVKAITARQLQALVRQRACSATCVPASRGGRRRDTLAPCAFQREDRGSPSLRNPDRRAYQQLSTRHRGRCPLRRSEEHTSELQSRFDLVCRLLLEKKKLGWRARSTATAASRSTAAALRLAWA